MPENLTITRNKLPKIANYFRNPVPVAYRQIASKAFKEFKILNLSNPLLVDIDSGIPPSSSLLQGLVAYWNADSLDGVDIISGNTVSPVSGNAENQIGKIGNCWSPLAGGAVIQRIADTINIQFASSFTLACWLRFETAPSALNGCFRKLSATRGYEISFLAGTGYRFTIGTGASTLNVDLAGGIDVDSNWHRLVAYYDATRNVIGIYKDNNVTTEVTLGASVYSPPLAADDLILAQLTRSGALTVRIDEMGMWSRVLTDSEKAEHWNNGNGKTYPF